MRFRPPPAERVRIAGPAGAIEAVIEVSPDSRPAAFAVVCHPHPLYGGTLENKVVHTLARAFQELGAASVRFNFRGVGESGGRFGEGAGEADDASAVIAWGRSRWPEAGLWLSGFSFGGAVAIRVAGPSHPDLLVTVAPALERVDLVGASMSDRPWLILLGDADDVVPWREVERWAARHAPDAQLVVLPGVGHYFHGRLQELRAAVTAFASRGLKKSPVGS